MYYKQEIFTLETLESFYVIFVNLISTLNLLLHAQELMYPLDNIFDITITLYIGVNNKQLRKTIVCI